jgi:hypothetical protein
MARIAASLGPGTLVIDGQPIFVPDVIPYVDDRPWPSEFVEFPSGDEVIVEVPIASMTLYRPMAGISDPAVKIDYRGTIERTDYAVDRN